MCVAKGIGGGFPLGACLATAEAAKGMTAGTHGSTYGGNPLGMAVGNEALDMVLAPGFLEHVRDRRATTCASSWRGLIAEHPACSRKCAAQGLMLGLKMRVPNTEFVAAARKHGLLIVGAGDNVVRLLPPLIVDGRPGARGDRRCSPTPRGTSKPTRKRWRHERASRTGPAGEAFPRPHRFRRRDAASADRRRARRARTARAGLPQRRGRRRQAARRARCWR